MVRLGHLLGMLLEQLSEKDIKFNDVKDYISSFLGQLINQSNLRCDVKPFVDNSKFVRTHFISLKILNVFRCRTTREAWRVTPLEAAAGPGNATGRLSRVAHHMILISQ